MNSIQQNISEQILPQMQNQDYLKSLKTGDSSFADALRAANSEQNSEKKVSTEENKDNSTVKVAEKDTSSEKIENSEEKIAENSSEKLNSDEQIAKNASDKKVDEDDKSEEKSSKKNIAKKSDVKDLTFADKSQEVLMLENISLEEIAEAENLNAENLVIVMTSDSDAEIRIDDNHVALSQEEVSYLFASENSDGNPELDEKIAKLLSDIHSIEELNDAKLTSQENLENAQALSLENPEKFLELAQTQILSSENSQISEKSLSLNKVSDDEKLSSVKEKKSGAKLNVYDLRNQKTTDSGLAEGKTVQKVSSKAELKITAQEQNKSDIQLTMELAGKAGQNITASSSQAAAAAGSDFQQMLSNAVQENAPEFVKAGNIILKDNNQGSINLILRPESLGNVKITLSLSDKVISGQITVASREAYDAFRENIDSIKQAFAQNGFDTGNFDLNFSNQQSFAQNNGQNQNEQNFSNSINIERSYGELVASSADSALESYENNSEYSINIVA